jgi:hypothetical protein
MTRPSVRARLSKKQVGRVAAGIVLGCLLGAVGLPRLELQLPPFSSLLEASPVPAAIVVRQQVEPTATVPLVTPVPTVAAPSAPRLLVAPGFGAVTQWPNDPEGTAWFANGEYHLYARKPGRFVAVGVPLPSPVGDVVVSAQFHKVGGPPGGGYGVIIRDQSAVSEHDGRSQAGQYLTLAVDDRGDFGVWQRDQTHWIDIVPWTHSGVVHLDTEANALVVSTHGTTLRFAVNGTVVADLAYEVLPATGGVGIFVGGDLNQVALEWLTIEG